MKKVLSILIAVVMCLAFSVMAFATEETTAINTEELSSVVDQIVDAAGDVNVEDLKEAVEVNGQLLADAFGDLLTDVDTVAFDEAADYVITSISELTGADLESVREIVMAAIDEYDLEKVEIVESTEVAGLLDNILGRLEELGIDTTPIIDKLAESKLGQGVIDMYIPTTTTTTAPSEFVETGAASSAAAFAVLAVAAAGAFVCTRKKAE